MTSFLIYPLGMGLPQREAEFLVLLRARGEVAADLLQGFLSRLFVKQGINVRLNAVAPTGSQEGGNNLRASLAGSHPAGHGAQGGPLAQEDAGFLALLALRQRQQVDADPAGVPHAGPRFFPLRLFPLPLIHEAAGVNGYEVPSRHGRGPSAGSRSYPDPRSSCQSSIAALTPPKPSLLLTAI